MVLWAGRPEPDVVGAAEDVPVKELVPGARVRRYTEQVDIRDDGLTTVLDVPVPCCDRQARVEHSTQERDTVVACPFCSLVYRLLLIDENDGGFAAELVVTDQVFVLARRRSRRARRKRAR
jgi:hypothetical protein